jgi:hypothetical protein
VPDPALTEILKKLEEGKQLIQRLLGEDCSKIPPNVLNTLWHIQTQISKLEALYQ